MRIGIDASCWSNGRGYGRYTREILGAMLAMGRDHEFVLFVDAITAHRLPLSGPNVERVVVGASEAPVTASAAGSKRKLMDLLRFTLAVSRQRLDVFFCPTVYSYFPLPPGLSAVVGIHDTIADRHPELCLPTARDRLFWRTKVALAIRQARLILTVSDFAAQQISEHFGVPGDRIRVAVEAPAEAYRPTESHEEIRRAAARLGLPSDARWFVYVGGFNPHKHVDVLVRAHAAIARARPEDAPYLLLVGDPESDVFHDAVETIRTAVQEGGAQDRVVWTGFVADEELRHLHSGSLALVLPSEEEGFGLPAVEAAACGSPVIATRQSPLPELLDGAGLFVQPGDESGLMAAMQQLQEDDALRNAMGTTALERARALNWERGARSVLESLHEAAV
jgi:glycosyltransferase involved in cell wall biosynthesis